MKLSEYIEKLEECLEQGDYEVVDSYDDPIGEPELNIDSDPVWVLVDKA